MNPPLPRNTLDYFASSLEAADILGTTSDHIARLCRSGALEGRKFGRTWFVARASLTRALVLYRLIGPGSLRIVELPESAERIDEIERLLDGEAPAS